MTVRQLETYVKNLEKRIEKLETGKLKEPGKFLRLWRRFRESRFDEYFIVGSICVMLTIIYFKRHQLPF